MINHTLICFFSFIEIDWDLKAYVFKPKIDINEMNQLCDD